MSIVVHGTVRVKAKIRGLLPEYAAALRPQLEEAARDVRDEAERLIKDPPKTGRVYMKTKPTKRRHQASAPGQSPADDMGELVNSLGVLKTDLRNLRIYIFASAKHARFLEFGTRRMAARPFLRRALNNLRADIIARLRAVRPIT